MASDAVTLVLSRLCREMRFTFSAWWNDGMECGWKLSSPPHLPVLPLLNSLSHWHRGFFSPTCSKLLYILFFLPLFCFKSPFSPPSPPPDFCTVTFQRAVLMRLTVSFCVFLLRVCYCRIWWMISARANSWRWATWTGARSTEAEAEGACLSGAVVSPLLEHTGRGAGLFTHSL